jgi:hypothetical protein
MHLVRANLPKFFFAAYKLLVAWRIWNLVRMMDHYQTYIHSIDEPGVDRWSISILPCDPQPIEPTRPHDMRDAAKVWFVHAGRKRKPPEYLPN